MGGKGGEKEMESVSEEEGGRDQGGEIGRRKGKCECMMSQCDQESA